MFSQTTDSLERFAELCAALDDSFAGRATALSEAGLDEAAWEHAQAYWTSQIRDDAGDTMAERFGATYAAKRRALMHGMRGALRIAPPPVSLPPVGDMDATTVAPSHVVGPALPFVPAPAPDPLEVTLDAPIGVLCGPVLPFVLKSPAR